ncbi:3-hydroxyacyl-CoA dehydrogenase NAD-binding domain-containing protein [Longibacter sp.]|uniref:3-hydroxyacyl-CoA dehydrogenase NAD-binding domain-containing protein n=1 Tax=Longibacter sp. TaxID=2045415 RepID=UPI003EB987F8
MSTTTADLQTFDLDTDLLTLSVDANGIATVTIDDPDASVNKISEDMLAAFEEVIGAVEKTPDIRGAVFISGKDNSFIAGADINMLSAFEMPADVRALSRRAHRLLARMQNLRIPTVAAINGAAMGGGLEMTLGATYRICTTHSKTKMALPEVQLGLLPGGGGTQYLPRLVGVQQALTMMLTGKNMYPRKARRIGLVDATIHPPGLHRAAVEAAKSLADGSLTIERDTQSFTEKLLESNTLSRRVIYQKAGEKAQKQARGNYPAPPKIIECVKMGMERGLEEGLDTEARHFGDLVFTPESRALVSLFFAKQEGDKNPNSDIARPVDTLGVLGAGLMGAGIAEVTAENGADVVLKDQNIELAAGGKKHIYKAMKKKSDRRIITEFERDQIVERVTPTGDYAAFRHADVVIEAVPEDLDLKQAILKDTEAVVRDDCVYATNTSSIPISDIAAIAEHPERVLGMHYFSPVGKMPLLEIVVTDETSDEAISTAYDAGLLQGKTVIVVKDGPGFYTTRILAIYMNEALLMLEEGGDVEEIDEMMKDFGFPMGPFELFDLVGIDVAAKITEVMRKHLDEEQTNISDSAATLVEAGLKGQKTEQGFYFYEPQPGKPEKKRTSFNDAVYRHFGGKNRTSFPADDVKERLGLMMVNEAIRCLEEGILKNPTDGDLGAVFGLGFPPFRGGPFRYVDQEGAGAIRARLERLEREHGGRFAPSALLTTHAENETRFHDE